MYKILLVVRCLFYFFFSIVCISCNLKSSQQIQIEKMEFLLDLYPDSVYFVLDSLINENDLNEICFAKSCLLVSKAADKTDKRLLSVTDYEKVLCWYIDCGTIDEQGQINYYLGRSYLEDMQYEKAMNAYLHALSLFKKIQDYDSAAYVSSYIADLFEIQNDPESAQRNYELAAEYFYKSGNTRSYTLALKDIARELAFQDSCELALSYLERADSLAFVLQDSIVKIAVYNSFGNVYRIMKRYADSEKYLLRAAAIDTVMCGIPNLLALSDLYIEVGDWDRASDYLAQVENNKSGLYIDMVKYNQYKLYKVQGKYKEALFYLEQYQDVFDSSVIASNEANLLEMEKKYDKLKVQQENQRLKLSQQIYVILFILSIFILLVVSLVYVLFKKRAKDKIHSQKAEILQFNIDVLNLSFELEQKKRLLDSMKKECLVKNKLEDEIKSLNEELNRIKKKQLLNSAIGKKLLLLSQKHIPGNTKVLISEKMFKAIEKEVKLVYPKFKSQILELCPGISDSDWRYCCFLLFNFDVKSEAILLCVNPASVWTRHFRMRQRLNIQLDKGSLYDYLINDVLSD